MSNKQGREYFKGICPYTDKLCKLWLCNICIVEHRERRYLKKEAENEDTDTRQYR